MKDDLTQLQRGEKLVFIPDGGIYDFGYIGATGKIIIYDEGECNFQNSYPVAPELLERVSVRDARRKEIESRRGLDYPAITICYMCHDGQGNYVMNKRSTQCNDEHGTWDFGGGRVEFGDSIMKTVRKELREEYGVVSPKEINFLGYHDLFRTSSRGLRHWLCIIFLVEVNRDHVINGEPHKFEELKWVTLDNLPSPLHPLVQIEVEMVRKLNA